MNYDTMPSEYYFSYECLVRTAHSIAVIENAIAKASISDTSFLQLFYKELEKQSHAFSVWQKEFDRLQEISEEISGVAI